MGLTLAAIRELEVGWTDPIGVGELRQEVITTLGWPSGIVYLSRETLFHVRERHPETTDIELCLVSLALRNGLIVAEDHRPNFVVVSYQHPEHPDRRYKASLKLASSRFDIWLTTFHRTARRQTRALLKRGRILQRHK